MRTRIHIYATLSLMLTALTLLSCGGSGNPSSPMPSGTLNLAVSDTPVDGATSVVVVFTGVQIQPEGGGHGDGGHGDEGHGMGSGHMGDDDQGEAPASGTSMAPPPATSGGDMGEDDDGGSKPLTFNFATPHQIDLMQQQGGNSASLLNGISLPTGHYAWIRLMVASSGSTITLTDGSVHPLTIPSGAESGLKLVHGFTVAAGDVVNFTIDFDLRRSIILANSQYILKPVLRLMDNLDVGRIHGTVNGSFVLGSTAITNPACGPAAYVYSGANITPVDIDPTSSVQPLATASVKLDDESGDYVYSVGFLAPGSYTVALVCAANDNPATLDNLVFSTPKNATVTSDTATEVDFP